MASSSSVDNNLPPSIVVTSSVSAAADISKSPPISPLPGPQSPRSFGHGKHQENQSSSSSAPSGIPRDINSCSKTSLQTFTYNYPFEQTVASYMLRFPKNSLMPVLLGSRVISDSVDSGTKIRTIVRKCFIDIEAPQWVKRALGSDHIEVTQTTTVDAANRKMRILNFNETFRDKAVFGDDCTFGVDDSDPNKTVFKQYGFFSLPKLPLAKVCEKIMCKTYEKHSAEGRNIDLAFLQEAVDTGFWRDLHASGPDCVLRMLLENPKYSKSPASPMLHSTVIAGDSTDGVNVGGVENVMSSLSLPEPAARRDGDIQSSTSAIISSGNTLFDESTSTSNGGSVENFQAAYVDLIWGSLAIALLPTALSLRGTLVIAIFTLVASAVLFTWHCAKHLDFWVFVLNRITDDNQQITSAKRSHSQRKLNSKSLTKSSSTTNSNVMLTTPAKNLVPLAVQRLDSSGTQHNASDDDEPSTVEEESEMSEKTAAHREESETESAEEEDYSEDDNEEYESQILNGGGDAEAIDDNLGDLNDCTLKDIQVSIPAFIEKLTTSGDDYEFVVEVVFPNGAHRTVERLYSDFVRIQVLFRKKLPNFKLKFEKTYIPKRNSNPIPLGMALDQRRLYLQSYLRELLTDEVIGKSASRIMIEFLKRRGPLFPPSTSLASTAKKRFIKAASATSTSDTASLNTNGKDFKTGVLFLLQWRSGLKEVRLTFDKSTGFLNLNTRGLRGVDSIIHLEDIEHINSHYHGATLNNAIEKPKIPFGRDKYAFLELKMINKDSYILCGSKDLIQQWAEELSAGRDSIVKNINDNSRIPAHINAPRRKPSDLSESAVVLNRKRIILTNGSGDGRSDPCDVAVSLLRSALGIYQEYTDAQYIKTPKITKKLEKFTEQCCDLQIIDLDSLKTHERTLSFFTNIYHTLVIHAHVEMEFIGMKTTPKRVRNILKNACYDISNFLFSVQDIEHSVLRAKMSHPVMINNPLFVQIPSPQFKRHDPRNRWTLQKADMRIDLILNSGAKSSIYNVWIFSSDPIVLNIQLDHATTHYLNEQVTVDNGRTTVYLPRVCQYFSKDFGGTKHATLKTLIPYLSSQMEREIKYMLRIEQKGGNKIKIRYDDYEWTMRGLFFRGHDVTVNNYQGCQLKPA